MKNLSIIIHGTINHRGTDTLANLKMTKLVFPYAQYILCTSDTVADDIKREVDILISYEDPGSFFSEPDVAGGNNPVLRQCRAIALGLKAARHDYAIKLRTDFAIVNDDFIRLWTLSHSFGSELLHFEKPVVVLDLGCNDPTRVHGLFHCSDFFFFGLKSDLLRYWDIESELVSITQRSFSLLEKLVNPLSGRYWGLLSCEQYLMSAFYRRSLKSQYFDFKMRSQFSWRLMRDYEKFLLSNFCIVSERDGILLPASLRAIYKEKVHYVPGEIEWIRSNYGNIFFARLLAAYAIRVRNTISQFPLACYAVTRAVVRLIVLQKRRLFKWRF